MGETVQGHPVTSTDRYDAIARAFRVLSDPMRLRILGLRAEAPATGVSLAGRLDLGAPTVSHHLGRLLKAGLVTATADGSSKVHALDTAFFDPREPPGDGSRSEDALVLTDDDRVRRRTLRTFFDGRTLRSIPAKRKQLVIVIQELLTRFEPGRDYPEREVNAILREAHEDVATLRRELVDYGYLRRADGVYRVSDAPPRRSVQLAQEMTGDERAWLDDLLSAAARRALDRAAGEGS